MNSEAMYSSHFVVELLLSRQEIKLATLLEQLDRTGENPNKNKRLNLAAVF